MVLLIMWYISDLEGLVGSSLPVIIASFAAISAVSLPSTPTWAGIQSMEMLNLTVEARFRRDNILSTLSGLDLDFPFCSACIALRESVKITKLGMLPLSMKVIACSKRAISSEVNTDRTRFNLTLAVWPSSGTTKAAPVVLAVGSLLPSVSTIIVNMASTIIVSRIGWYNLPNISCIPKLITSKLGILNKIKFLFDLFL